MPEGGEPLVKLCLSLLPKELFYMQLITTIFSYHKTI